MLPVAYYGGGHPRRLLQHEDTKYIEYDMCKKDGFNLRIVADSGWEAYM